MATLQVLQAVAVVAQEADQTDRTGRQQPAAAAEMDLPVPEVQREGWAQALMRPMEPAAEVQAAAATISAAMAQERHQHRLLGKIHRSAL
jgi:hypothetical protein